MTAQQSRNRDKQVKNRETVLSAIRKMPGSTAHLAFRTGLSVYAVRKALRTLQADDVVEWKPIWHDSLSYTRVYRLKA